jgi:hypothetical protein
MGIAGRFSILGLGVAAYVILGFAVAAYLVSPTIPEPPHPPQQYGQGSGPLASSQSASVQTVEPLVASWAGVFTPDGRAANSCAGNTNALGLASHV